METLFMVSVGLIFVPLIYGIGMIAEARGVKLEAN